MYTGIHKQYYKGYTSIHRCSGIAILRCTQAYTGIHKYTQIYARAALATAHRYT
jgi:hypothetical protein